MIWNSFMTKRGWRDEATASLNRWIIELGLRDRNDLQTFSTYMMLMKEEKSGRTTLRINDPS
jgi:hypothetical protein